jgi:cytosine/adenosine deaminase-related metal-dependent hydrolase
MKVNRFFRYLWRVDAALILVAAGAIAFGVGVLVYEELGDRAALRHNAEAGVPVSANPAVELNLGHAETVDGTRVLRADLYLYTGGAGFSSGVYKETRNILFIEPLQEAAYWLLTDK